MGITFYMSAIPLKYIYSLEEMAQLAEHWSSLPGDLVPDQKVVSSNPGDTRGLLGSHLNKLVYTII